MSVTHLDCERNDCEANVVAASRKPLLELDVALCNRCQKHSLYLDQGVMVDAPITYQQVESEWQVVLSLMS